MAVNGRYSRGGPGRTGLEDARIDTRRYLTAISRSRWLIAGIVLAVTGIVAAASLLLPEQYEAEATLVYEPASDVLGSTDTESVQRQLTTINTLLTSTAVVEAAAREVPGETPSSLRSALSTSVDQEANIINVLASDGDPRNAADIANTVTETFLEVRADSERERLEAARQQLLNEIEAVEASGSATAEEEIRALRERVSQLSLQIAQAGSDLQLAEPAEVPSDPASPRPIRNTVLALFASLLIGVLVALGRDQLRPRLADPRELSRLIGRPVMAAIPYVRRGGRRMRTTTAVEHEAYETLHTQMVLAFPPEQTQLVVVTSALHGEGKSTVTARIGRAMAAAGYKTLLVSADMRWPTLHQVFDLPLKPGLSDLIRFVESSGINEYLVPATANPIELGVEAGDPKLQVLTAGSKPADPARLIGSEAATQLFAHLRDLDFDYVLFDAPPTLGIADVQVLLRHVKQTLLVARIESLTTAQVIDLRELLDQLGAQIGGVVVIGARVDVSPYYLSEGPSGIGAAGLSLPRVGRR